MRIILPLLCLGLLGCGRDAVPPVTPPPPAPPPTPAKLVFPAVFTHPDTAKSPAATRKTIVFLTDDGAHGWMQHENTAGAVLFAKRLARAYPECEAIVLRDSFPDAALLERAACFVLFCSGTDRHPLNDPARLDAMTKACKAGAGLVALHWALEAGTPAATAFLNETLGGSFEVNWSVNPMWKGDFTAIPPHEITRGVKPFSIYDEFYFNMRFPEVAGTRIPLLEAIPPKKVILMPEDGPRTNNPAVRGSLGKPHVTAWAYLRPGGGRAFGFTGGHFHWDWKHDDFRRVLLNGLAWSAGLNVPETGVIDTTPDDKELLENQDSPPLPGWQPMPGQPGMDMAPSAPSA